ncbi:MAG: redox-sensing transcriptional repressor Rex [Clostridia bacterium]|nr:redox-sensing transcriptional repressor Rex [Clostridia bacterium]MBR6780388.1 redox-sensing transcriptional repressor Rex [Clostridia bacterium]
MKDSGKISPSVIRRLPRYYRFLSNLEKAGVSRISSKALSEKMGVTASQIRQDLNCFGGFGQQGYGYNIKDLKTEIEGILGIDHKCKIILMGAGNLGRAVATHMPFDELGFELIGIYDAAPLFTGLKIKDLPIKQMDTLGDFCRLHKPQTAILCVPDDSAKELVAQLYKLGVHSFWNFTHYDILTDFPDALVENVHLSDSLMTLSYQIKCNF